MFSSSAKAQNIDEHSTLITIVSNGVCVLTIFSGRLSFTFGLILQLFQLYVEVPDHDKLNNLLLYLLTRLELYIYLMLLYLCGYVVRA